MQYGCQIILISNTTYMLPNLLTLNSNYNDDIFISLQNLFLNLFHIT